MARETKRSQYYPYHPKQTPRQSGSRRLSLERLEDRRLLSIEPNLLVDAHVGPNFSDPDDFVEVGGLVFFTAFDGEHGRELWASDGTPLGTELVLDILPGSPSSQPSELTQVGDLLFFTASDEAENDELWKSDGTSAGTVQVLEIRPGVEGSHPTNLTNFGGLLAFTADNGTDGEQFWTSNGTAMETVRFTSQEFIGSIEHVTSIDGKLYFSAADSESGREFWTSHGSDATTARVLDIQPGVNDSSPSDLIVVGDVLFFTAEDGTHGRELWTSNGSAAGTVLVQDIRPGEEGSALHDLTDVEGTLFFSASDGTHGDELWTSDGSSLGTDLVVDLNPGISDALPKWTTHVGGTVLFSATNGLAETPQLWKSDGTSEGTEQLNEITPYFITEMYSEAFFGGGGGLWKSDGTVEGTFLVQPPAGQKLRHLRNLTNVGGRLFFGGNDLVVGREPWSLATRPPVAVDDLYTVEHHQELIVDTVDGLLSNDQGDSPEFAPSPLEVVLVDEPSHGELTLQADGSFHYVPDRIFSGTDHFTYYVDSGLYRSETASVDIEVQFVDYLDFHSPKDGILYVSAVGGSEALTTVSELGFGTATTPHRPRLTGLPTVSSEIFAGYVHTGELIPLSVFTEWENLTSYASSSINTGTSFETFLDWDNSLGWDNIIIEQTAADTWLLHMDDAFPLFDRDDELLVQLRIADALMPTDLGTLGQTVTTGIDLSAGDVWFELETAHDGILTLETFFTGAPDDANLILMNQRGFELATSETVVGGERIDWDVSASEIYYIKITGVNTDVDLRATNLVDVSNWDVTVNGTDGYDLFELDATFATGMTINGVDYPLQPGDYWAVSFDGGVGDDGAILLGTPANESAVVQTGAATLSSGRMTFEVVNVTELELIGGGGVDRAEVFDSPEDDVATLTPDLTEIAGGGFHANLEAFSNVQVISSGLGDDFASCFDGPGDDVFLGRPTESTLQGPGFSLLVEGFDEVHAYAKQGGHDTATLHDSDGDDTFVATPIFAKMFGEGFLVRAKFFEQAEGIALRWGHDVAQLYDSAGDDTFSATPEDAHMMGADFSNRATRFEQVTAYAKEGGDDMARLYDSPGDDLFTAFPTRATLDGPGYWNKVVSFDQVHAYAKEGGHDVASLFASGNADTLVSTSIYTKLFGPHSLNRAKFFEQIEVTGTEGGADVARLYDSPGDDLLEAFDSRVRLTTDTSILLAQHFAEVTARSSSGGIDTKDIRTIDFLLETVGPWISLY